LQRRPFPPKKALRRAIMVKLSADWEKTLRSTEKAHR